MHCSGPDYAWEQITVKALQTRPPRFNSSCDDSPIFPSRTLPEQGAQGKPAPATAAMDNGSDDRVYAAEKIIQKRVKKVRTSIPQLRAPRYKCFPLPGQGRVPGKMEGVEPKVQHMGAGGKHSRHAAHRDLRGLTGGNRRTKQEARPEEQEGEDGSVECCCCGCCRRGA